MGGDSISRRSFLHKSRALGTGASTFTLLKPERIRGAGKEPLTAGLVGCGHRGRQAAIDTLTGNDNVRLVALADIFEDNLELCLKQLRDASKYPGIQSRIRVDPEHRFVGFDAYKKVLASEIDIVMLCTPPAYRPLHFEAAVEAGKHVFAEKPFGTDPVNLRRFMAAARKSEALKLTVVSGAQRRRQKEYVETIEKIQNGAIGEVVATYAYWLTGVTIADALSNQPRNPKWSDMEWQNRAWYSFVWICGDQIVEQLIHNIDVINWVMGTHPVKVVACGGAAWRPQREELYGNIYDHVSADFLYANGVHMSAYCRQYRPRPLVNVSELVIGTKGRSNCKDLGTKGANPYVQEHIDLVNSILGRGPYVNHGMAVAESTMTAIMARESAYSGQEITWDQIMASQQDLLPRSFDYAAKLDVPPTPVPGVYKFV